MEVQGRVDFMYLTSDLGSRICALD